MTTFGLRIIAGFGALAAAAVLASCAGHSDQAAPSASTSATVQMNPHNESDISFALSMGSHHRQAIELAGLVQGRTSNPAIATLASQIAAAQEPEVAAMNALLTQWVTAPDESPHHSEADMQGMVDDATIAKLKTLSGTAFDTLWLQSMVSHHEGAIAMANAEIAKGQNADMIAMAQNMAAAQQSEIDQMKKLLGG